MFVFKSLEILVILYALYLSYIGIWKRDGVNKDVKQSIMTKQGLWIVFRLLIYMIAYIPNGIVVYCELKD